MIGSPHFVSVIRSTISPVISEKLQDALPEKLNGLPEKLTKALPANPEEKPVNIAFPVDQSSEQSEGDDDGAALKLNLQQYSSFFEKKETDRKAALAVQMEELKSKIRRKEVSLKSNLSSADLAKAELVKEKIRKLQLQIEEKETEANTKKRQERSKKFGDTRTPPSSIIPDLSDISRSNPHPTNLSFTITNDLEPSIERQEMVGNNPREMDNQTALIRQKLLKAKLLRLSKESEQQEKEVQVQFEKADIRQRPAGYEPLGTTETLKSRLKSLKQKLSGSQSVPSSPSPSLSASAPAIPSAISNTFDPMNVDQEISDFLELHGGSSRPPVARGPTSADTNDEMRNEGEKRDREEEGSAIQIIEGISNPIILDTAERQIRLRSLRELLSSEEAQLKSAKAEQEDLSQFHLAHLQYVAQLEDLLMKAKAKVKELDVEKSAFTKDLREKETALLQNKLSYEQLSKSIATSFEELAKKKKDFSDIKEELLSKYGEVLPLFAPCTISLDLLPLISWKPILSASPSPTDSSLTPSLSPLFPSSTHTSFITQILASFKKPPSNSPQSNLTTGRLASSLPALPKDSPLLLFRSSRLLPNYPYPLKSKSHSHKINPMKPFCKFELRGVCNDELCPGQHLRDYSLTDVQVLLDLADYASCVDIAVDSDKTQRQDLLQHLRPIISEGVTQGYSDLQAKKIAEGIHQLSKNTDHFLPLSSRTHRLQLSQRGNVGGKKRALPQPGETAKRDADVKVDDSELYLEHVLSIVFSSSRIQFIGI